MPFIRSVQAALDVMPYASDPEFANSPKMQEGLAAFGHAVEHRFAGPAADPPKAIRGATRFERAGTAGLVVAVIDQSMPLDLRVVTGLETLSAEAKIGVTACVVAKLLLAEQPIADRGPALWSSDIGIDAGRLARLDIFAFIIALVSDGIEPHHAEHFFGGASGLRQQP